MIILFGILIFIVSLGSFDRVQAADHITQEQENNDTIQAANPIKPNTYYTGKIENWDYWGDKAQDYFKVTLPSDGNVILSIANKVDIGWKMNLLDGNGNWYTGVNTLTSVDVVDKNIKKSEVSIGLPKGTYYIHIEGNDEKTVGIPYVFSVKFSVSNYYEREFNDSVQTANNIALNQSYNGCIEYWNYWGNRAQDYYRLVLPNDGNVTLSLANKVGVGWKITLLDGSGNVYRNESSNTSVDVQDKNIKRSEISVGLPKGTYYVRIEGVDEKSINIPYEFMVKYQSSLFYEREFNDSIGTSNQVVLNQIYTGEIEYYDYWGGKDNDYYRVQLNQSGNITLQMQNQTSSTWNFDIKNGNGDVLQTGTTNNHSTGKSYFTYNLSKGVYYIRVYGDDSTVSIPYHFSVNASFPTPTLAAKQISVVNNTGKKDIVSVKNLQVGDIVKVYNQFGKLLGTSKPVQDKQSSATISVIQFGTNQGKIYVSVTNYGMKESSKKEITFSAEKVSATLVSNQIKVTNNRGKYDVVTVNALQEGDVIKVYDKSGKLIGTSQPVAKSKSSVNVNIKQLSTSKGTIFVSVTSSGKLESSKTSTAFVGEKSSKPPSNNSISITVSLKISSLQKGDIVKVYNHSGQLMVTSKPVSNGQTSVTVSIPKQANQQEQMYITVTSEGADESTNVAVTI
jgi:hypothetical protein